MNISLVRTKRGFPEEYLLYSIKKNGVGYSVRWKKVTPHGMLILSQGEPCSSEMEARLRIQKMVKIKIKKSHCVEVPLEKLPKPVVKFLEVPPELMVTPEELVMILREHQKERYVILSDVSGLEEYFDADIEYLGYVTDDESIIKVFDRFGTLRNCFTHRALSLEHTEMAVEALNLKQITDGFNKGGVAA